VVATGRGGGGRVGRGGGGGGGGGGGERRRLGGKSENTVRLRVSSFSNERLKKHGPRPRKGGGVRVGNKQAPPSKGSCGKGLEECLITCGIMRVGSRAGKDGANCRDVIEKEKNGKGDRP